MDGARLEPRQVKLGGHAAVRFVLTSMSRRLQDLLVDLAVHFVKADGRTVPKVFKLKRLKLAARASAEFETKVSFAPMTTRRHSPGRHRAEAIVNGTAYPLGGFTLK